MDQVKSIYSDPQTEPSSLLGCSLVRKNVSSQVTFWVASISLISKAVYRLYFIFTTGIDHREPPIIRYEQLLIQMYSLCLGLTIMNFEFNRSVYITYLDCYQTIVSEHFSKSSSKFVNKWVKIIRFWVLIAFLYELTTITIHTYLRYFHKIGLQVNFFATILVVLISQVSYILSMQFIIECCIYCQATFIPINTLLNNFLHQNKHSTPIKMYRMARVTRSYYFETIKSIRYMDKFLAFAVLVFYFYFSGRCIFLFGRFFQGSSTIYLQIYNFFRFFGEASYLVLVTYHLARVNRLSVKIFDKVYALTHSSNSDSVESINEINLFLLRIDRNDVGFTFAGLCLVSPSFVSSLATISLTVGLALPNLFK
uniref:Gustatory receptor n=1 Tax=Tetranychus urticae TaxID=32264 RepID=T1KRG7_TETUR